MIPMTPLLKDMAISARLRADLKAARDWPIHEELGADMIGEVLDARYRIVSRIAKGGMADVFLAKDQTRKCPVAIKILRSRKPEAARRRDATGDGGGQRTPMTASAACGGICVGSAG